MTSHPLPAMIDALEGSADPSSGPGDSRPAHAGARCTLRASTMRATPRQLSAATFGVVAFVCVAAGHPGLGAVVALTMATSLMVHRPRCGYAGQDRSLGDALNPILCQLWAALVVLQLGRHWVAETAGCLVTVAVLFGATRRLPYCSGWRDAAHVGMHLVAGAGTVALVAPPT